MLLAIGVPTTGLVHARTMVSLTMAVRALPASVDVCLEAEFGCYVALNREEIARRALARKSDYVLFVDADMEFAYDSINRLLRQSVPIVGAHYNRRDFPLRPVEIDLEGQPLSDAPLKITTVGAVGGGLLLVHSSVFERLPRPWFRSDWMDGKFKGEDVWFCESARRAGYDIWCDPGVDIKHIGEHRF